MSDLTGAMALVGDFSRDINAIFFSSCKIISKWRNLEWGNVVGKSLKTYLLMWHPYQNHGLNDYFEGKAKMSGDLIFHVTFACTLRKCFKSLTSCSSTT